MLTRIVASAALMLALAVPVWAQQGRDDQSRQQRAEQRAAERDTDDRPTNQLTLAEADTIQGSEVRNRQGDQIGEVEDVVLEVKKGQVAYAIVGVGGFLGLGEKSVAVPWSRLQPGDRPQSFVLNVDRQTLEAAPAVDPDKVAQLEGDQARQRISQFWQRAETEQAQTPERDGGRRQQQ